MFFSSTLTGIIFYSLIKDITDTVYFTFPTNSSDWSISMKVSVQTNWWLELAVPCEKGQVDHMKLREGKAKALQLPQPTWSQYCSSNSKKHVTCFKYFKRLKNCLEFKLYVHSSMGQWYWQFTPSLFFKMLFLWCFNKCMSKLAVFLNTLLQSSSGQWMFVFITESSDGGGHILITLILKYKHKTNHSGILIT